MQQLSIVINGEKTSKLKGLAKTVPYAVVMPNTLHVTDGVVHGLALYASQCTAPFEMSVAEFQQLEFSFISCA
jgi:hypothetical protein